MSKRRNGEARGRSGGRPDSAVAGWRMLPQLGPGEPRAVHDIRDALAIREGTLFLLTDSQGNLATGNQSGLGLYHNDCRYLAGWQLTLIDVEPIVLLSTAELGFAMEQVMINPELINDRGDRLPAGSFDIRRQRVLDNALIENIALTNRALVPLALTLQYEFDADFADIFEVRGMKRRIHGKLSAIRVHNNGVTFRYSGSDGIGRHTRIRFRPSPAEVEPHRAIFRLEIPAGKREEITAVVLADAIAGTGSARRSIQLKTESFAKWANCCTKVNTSNELFNAALDRSFNDLRMLWSQHDGSGLRYLSAGIPWFNSLFGRDSLLAAMMFLAYNPAIARDTLRSLVRFQGLRVDAWRDEEPGKILHELRQCESANTGEIVFGRYYGSIDSTPLFILLAAEYYRWTADLDTLRELMPAIRLALAWTDNFGDLDGDGYLEYVKKSEGGLDNQGWKDSWDGIVDEHGELVSPPVALVEVQGLVYAAKTGISAVFEALGDEQRATFLRDEAARLRRRINADFWTGRGHYAQALDAGKRPVRTLSSNAGQLLLSGVPSSGRARSQIQRLMRGDMFSGWGLRTLSSTARRYNPMGYHLGTIWPHDNALILAGFKRYGAERELNQVATALCEAAFAFQYFRLPELFSGAPRTSHQAPVPYPVACRPQAWAAASLPFVLTSILGIVPDAANRRLHIVRPRLPDWMEFVRLTDLKIGRHSVGILFRRSGQRTVVEVTRKGGPVEVLQTDRWPNI